MVVYIPYTQLMIMEKYDSLLELLTSILGDAGAEAEISLLKSLKEDLEKKKSPEFLKYVTTSTLDHLDRDAEKTPNTKEKVVPEKEQEGTLTLPKSKPLDERLDAVMERCITEADLDFIRGIFLVAAQSYSRGDDAFTYTPESDPKDASHVCALRTLIEFILPWLYTATEESTPIMESALEEEQNAFPEVLKKVPNTILLRWGKYLDEDDFRSAWENLESERDEDEDEVIGNYIDTLKDIVIGKLIRKLQKESSITIDDPEIMSEVIDAIDRYSSNYGLIRVNDTIRII